MARLGGADESSFEQFSRSTIAWKRGTLRATSSRGVMPPSRRVCSILMPCSIRAVRRSGREHGP
jgi:hypothetical protein